MFEIKLTTIIPLPYQNYNSIILALQILELAYGLIIHKYLWQIGVVPIWKCKIDLILENLE